MPKSGDPGHTELASELWAAYGRLQKAQAAPKSRFENAMRTFELKWRLFTALPGFVQMATLDPADGVAYETPDSLKRGGSGLSEADRDAIVDRWAYGGGGAAPISWKDKFRHDPLVPTLTVIKFVRGCVFVAALAASQRAYAARFVAWAASSDAGARPPSLRQLVYATITIAALCDVAITLVVAGLHVSGAVLFDDEFVVAYVFDMLLSYLLFFAVAVALQSIWDRKRFFDVAERGAGAASAGYRDVMSAVAVLACAIPYRTILS